MALTDEIANFAGAVGTDMKKVMVEINGKQADLAALQTTAKANLVDAINEVLGVAQAAANTGGAQINDSGTETTTTLSSSEIGNRISTAIANLVAAAPGTLDTLVEIATALDNDPNFATTITTALANRLRFDAAQTLTTTEKNRAANNMGVGPINTNFVTAYTTARDAP